ncbi:unnamed protein product [Rodentolepis nana]|uniref:Aamy domain-containing protein n=1 Tax=Rodentolepis nana TaxID=102285 RepID=A0A0R3TSM6_RODNA|nr:unnamed protein product [Rodentolepis nana]
MVDHLIEDGDCKDVEEIGFIDKDKTVDGSEDEYPLLTKEDLMRIDRENPRWRWFRISLIVLFWVVWFGLIAVSAIYITLTPRCAPRPVQEFWQSGVGYWVNPFAFKNSGGDLVGDLKGLATAIDYVSETVGAGFVVLTSMTPFYPKHLQNDSLKSFEQIHPKLGTVEDFESFVRTMKKKGIKVVVTLNFNSVPLPQGRANVSHLIPAEANEFCRTGTSCSVSIGESKFYSTFGAESNSVDLNLKDSGVLEEIKNATRFWLSKGADGILLADAAFYVGQRNCSHSSWSDSFPACKLYTSETISVIQELRKVVDEESLKSSRNRFLIADPGNTSYNENPEPLLGTEEHPGAHVVISRAFTFKSAPGADLVNRFHEYMNASQLDRLGLMVASPNDKPYSDIFSAASVLLLPGTPLVYAGIELGWSPEGGLPPNELYPFGENPPVGSVTSHLPMPWDSRGTNFSDYEGVGKIFSKYINDFSITETVETAMAAGRGSSVFGLTQSLIKLRKSTPSLQWGSFNLTKDLAPSDSFTIFKRSAPGFDSIFVVMVRPGAANSVIDFSTHCSSLTPLVVYPPNSAFKPEVKMFSLKVYFASTSENNLYVFSCVA